jgi:hypothetical protein
MEEENSEKKQINLFNEEEPVLPFAPKEDSMDISRDLREAKEMELIDERIRRLKGDNDIKEGLLVYKNESMQETAFILNSVLSAFNEMVDSSPNSQIRDLLEQFYNSWVLKIQSDIESYMQARSGGNA